MKPLYLRSVNSMDAGRSHLSQHHRVRRNEMNEMIVVKWCNEIFGWGKRGIPQEKPIQIPFRLPRYSHGVTEMRTLDLSGGRQMSNRFLQGTALVFINVIKYMLIQYIDFHS